MTRKSTMLNPHNFVVLEGGAAKVAPWLNPPTTVIGRSPFDREPQAFRIAKHDVQKGIAADRRQPVFELWSNVLGRSPPVPNVSRWDDRLRLCSLSSLSSASACFRGVKRPVGADDNGWDMVAFATKPRWQFVYDPDMVCVASLEPVPEDLVFVTYVRLDQPEEGRFGGASTQITRGTVTHWQFVEADLQTLTLPKGHKERYRKRLW